MQLVLLMGLHTAWTCCLKTGTTAEGPIDKAWWDGLSEEWKRILLINQQFQKQRLDFFTLQEKYMNRMKAAGEDDYSPLNTSLYELNDKKRYSLGYNDFYARALRGKWIENAGGIDLNTLKELDKVYMVNGPADLTPLKKLSNLKVLIMNSCEIDISSPVSKQRVDLEPLRYLTKLEVLECAHTAIASLGPIKGLSHLRELNCENSGVTDLSPIKNLPALERLSCGPGISNEPIITKMVNLQELYLKGFTRIPEMTRCKKLQKLSVSEGEMAIVRASYRLTDLGPMKDLAALEYLDLNNSSYRGSLDVLNGLQNLKVITLPPVSTSIMEEFKKQHEKCIIINAYQYER